LPYFVCFGIKNSFNDLDMDKEAPNFYQSQENPTHMLEKEM